MSQKAEQSAYSKLSPKRRAFVDAYFECRFNGTQAAIMAKYSKNAAKEQAARLLTNDNVKKAIAERRTVFEKQSKLKVAEVVDELRRLGFSDISNIVSWTKDTITVKDSSELTPEVTACIAEITQTETPNGRNIKIKLHSKTAALEMLGRYLAMFTEKHEHTGKDGGAIELKTEHNLSKLSKDELRQLLALVEKAGNK